jgi:hypothetical protein
MQEELDRLYQLANERGINLDELIGDADDVVAFALRFLISNFDEAFEDE